MDKESLRENAQSTIRHHIRRSKVLGRGLATVSVAAGIALGVSSTGKETPAVVSGLVELGTVAGGAATAASTQRRCRRTVESYRQVIDMEGLAEVSVTDVGRRPKVASRVGRFALRQFDRAVYPINGGLLPAMAWYGAAEIVNYACYGGNLLPTGLSSLGSGSENYDPGLLLGAGMLVQGSLLLNHGVNRPEQYYARQLDEIDGLDLADQPAAA